MAALLVAALIAIRAPGTSASAARADQHPVAPVTAGSGLDARADTTAPAGARAARRAATARLGARRAAELRRLRHSRGVTGALRRAWLAGRIDAQTLAAHRRTWVRARAAARRLAGAAGVEQRGAVGLVAGLARERQLSSSRLAAAFVTLGRNTEFWSQRGPPRPGTRETFGRDPVVLRYEPGQGLQIHWLGTWGRVNARAGFCLRHRARCPRTALAGELDRLIALASRRHGYAAYEELYRFAGGAPAWVSGMVQGTAVQALARARRALAAPRFGRAARQALGAFEASPPAGVAVRDGRGRHYLMYSFAADLRILNGELQALTGLHDMAALTGSQRARRLFRSGERAARAAVPRYDTGAWSLYSAGGRESTLAYHRLLDGFLVDLCGRTHRGAYCATARRFARYEREPPRITLTVAARPRAEDEARVSVTISKGASAELVIRGPRGFRWRRGEQLARGRHLVVWRPPHPGRYRLRLIARGLSGPSGSAARELRVATSRRVLAARRHAALRRRSARRRARAERRETAALRAAATARRDVLAARARAEAAAPPAPVG